MKQIVIIVSVLLLAVAGVMAQDAACPAVVATAVDTARAGCSGMGSNEVCYGAGDLMLDSSGDGQVFDESGTVVRASTVLLLQSSALDMDTESLGLALVRLADPAQQVLLALVGDVQLRNAVTQPVGELLAVTASGGLNVRGGPSTSTPVVAGLTAGQEVIADGASADGEWLRIRLPEDGGLGWVFAALVAVDGDIAALNVVGDSDAPVASPLQAIHLSTGLNPLSCSEARANGILIQTPVDADPANLTINDVPLMLSGTFYVEAGGELAVNALEGSGAVVINGVAQRLVAGSRIRVPVDDNGRPVGDAEATDPYDETLMAALPLALLDREIEVVPALSADEIAALTACQVVAENDVNLRGGPGMVYPTQETLAAGAVVPVIGQAEGTDEAVWWQLDSELWVRSDVVETEGRCELVPAVEAPPVPTPAVGRAADITYRIDLCSTGVIQAGQAVGFYLGGGGWQQVDDARGMVSEVSGSIDVDGVPLRIRLGTIQWGQNDYGVQVAGTWEATSGTHQINANLDLFGGVSASCTVTVP